MKRSFFTLLLATFAGISGVSAQEKEVERAVTESEKAVTFEGAYQGAFFSNMAGGMRQGGGYLGMGNIMIGVNTEAAKIWKGGEFFINGAATHGGTPSETFIGDFQVASNMEAGNHVYLQELWFRQHFGPVSLTAGVQDANIDFMASEFGGEFVNSSFGTPSSIATNVPISIFPITGLGLTARWDISDKFAWQAAAYDGYNYPFEMNPNNVKYSISKDDGIFAITELQFTPQIGGLQGSYKLGGYYDSGTSGNVEPYAENWGVYLNADQVVMENDARNSALGVFLQAAYAPQSHNDNDLYIGGGVCYYGVFNRKGKDLAGLGVAYANLNNMAYPNETALELFYQYNFCDNFGIKGDLQYIINPAGTDEKLSNALVGMLLLYVNF